MRTLLIAATVIPLLVGCSQIPKPATYKYSYQQKMQAAHHWEVLAQQVADSVATEYVGIVDRGVYVEPSTGTFGTAFSEMLKTELVRRRIALSGNAESAAVLSFDVQIVRHRAKWPHRTARQNPGIWTAASFLGRYAAHIGRNTIIPAGVALELLDGTWAGVSEHEVVITTSLEKDGAYVMRRSDMYYVNDADAAQYALRRNGDTKTMEVVAQ